MQTTKEHPVLEQLIKRQGRMRRISRQIDVRIQEINILLKRENNLPRERVRQLRIEREAAKNKKARLQERLIDLQDRIDETRELITDNV